MSDIEFLHEFAREWPVSNDALQMHKFVFKHRLVCEMAKSRRAALQIDRKMRLLACACHRANMIENRKSGKESRRAVIDAERIAYGLAPLYGHTLERGTYWCLSPSACRAAEVFSQSDKNRGRSRSRVCDLYRDIFGKDFAPVSTREHRGDGAPFDPIVREMLDACFRERHGRSGLFDRALLSMIADYLEDNDCEDSELLDHLRNGADHVLGCWALDELVSHTKFDMGATFDLDA